jgi:uncharacterized protein (TIGR02996 family)
VSDDDAFIRTIVDSPGDDTPRLVYADWLDERGDPRGEYLRAEAEMVGSQAVDAAALKGLAAGLDPVWVARVSRPPVGVCCDHLYFTDCGPRLSLVQLDEIRRWNRVRLPDDYTAFLLNYNGGVTHLISNYLRPPSDVHAIYVDQFYIFQPSGDFHDPDTLHGEVDRYWNKTLPDYLETSATYSDSELSWYHDFIPVGTNIDEPVSVLVGVYGEHRGRIQLLDLFAEPSVFSDLSSNLLGDSFSGLLARILPSPAD